MTSPCYTVVDALGALISRTEDLRCAAELVVKNGPGTCLWKGGDNLYCTYRGDEASIDDIVGFVENCPPSPGL